MRARAMAVFVSIGGFWLACAQTTGAVTPDDPSDTGLPVTVPFELSVGEWVDLYVNADSGNDGSGDGSQSSPLRSLGEAISRAADQPVPVATRIHLSAGAFGGLGTVQNVQRTATSPIVVRGAVDTDGEPLTIVDGGANGTVAAGSMCLRLSTVAYLVVENIRCENAFPHGVNVDDGSDYSSPTHHVVFRNWRIRNVGVYLDLDNAGNSDCLKLSGVDDFWVLNSEFENCVRGEFIDMVGSHRGTIARNYFHDKPHNGVQMKGGSSDILFTRNTLERVEQRFVQLGGDVDTDDYRPRNAPYPASRISVVANVIRDVGTYSGSSDHGSLVFSLNGCNDCIVAHNTILDMQYRATLAFLVKEEADLPGNNDIVVANNIYVMDDEADRPRSTAAEFRVSDQATATAGEVQFVNEVYFDADDPDGNPIDLPSALEPGQFSGVAVFDPGLDARARPEPGSPVIGFGATGFEARVPGDYLGSPFPSPPAAGAFSPVQATRPNPPVLHDVQ